MTKYLHSLLLEGTEHSINMCTKHISLATSGEIQKMVHSKYFPKYPSGYFYFTQVEGS